MMAITTPEQILKVLRAFNPWWTTGQVPQGFLKAYRRFAYYEAMKRLDQMDIRRTVVLTGTRRVGKTTIEYQMIDTLLRRGVSPNQIVFISLDHPMLKLSSLSDILECYHENVWPTQDVYYFFDEVQYANSWDKWLKIIYDTQPETKCVATGSASPALIRGSAESGAGRWSVIQVPTLSFYEYCALIGVSAPELGPEIRPTAFANMTQQERSQIMLKLAPLQNHFSRYLTVGGFPELAARIGELQPLPPVEELRPQLLLHAGDAAAESLLADVQPLRGAGDVSRLGRRQKIFQILEIHAGFPLRFKAFSTDSIPQDFSCEKYLNKRVCICGASDLYCCCKRWKTVEF